jgi:hypothetical protein
MKELPEENIEQKIISGLDFVCALRTNEILKEIGEDPYRSELRLDIGEFISNLSRTMAGLYIGLSSEEEIETEIDAALIGERSSLTPIRLSEEKRQQVKNLILEKVQQFSGK